MIRRILLVAIVALSARGERAVAQSTTPIAAAADSFTKGLQAERRNDNALAARYFIGALALRPADVGALMGLERVLPTLDRRAELGPLLSRALMADSSNIGILGIAVRTFATLGRGDSARKYTLRWAARAPDDEGPFREWAMAAMDVRDRPQTKDAVFAARERLKAPTALGPEYAQLLQMEGDLDGAVREWILAARAIPGLRGSAVILLGQATVAQRAAVRAALQREGSVDARRILGLLLARWGESTDGAIAVRTALPDDKEQAIGLLRSLLEELRGREDKPTVLARATALEAIAERQGGQPAVRTRLDAARAYADAGNERDARRLLAVIAADSAAPAGMATTASSALLGVLLAEGKATEAEKVLHDLGTSLDLDERERQTRRVAMAYARQGLFARAESLVVNDSSVSGFDLRGRLRLFAGDLNAASALLKVAGPYDDERETAVERVTLLTLLQAAKKDSLPALGAAMLALERGDSAKAIDGLATLAGDLEPNGAAEARLLAGRLALARRDTATASKLLKAADVAEAPATAAAARLDLARLAVLAGHPDEARALLEKLILDFPESAVVPEARRMRDTLRGAIPEKGL